MSEHDDMEAMLRALLGRVAGPQPDPEQVHRERVRRVAAAFEVDEATADRAVRVATSGEGQPRDFADATPVTLTTTLGMLHYATHLVGGALVDLLDHGMTIVSQAEAMGIPLDSILDNRDGGNTARLACMLDLWALISEGRAAAAAAAVPDEIPAEWLTD